MNRDYKQLVQKYPKILANARIEAPPYWYDTIEDLCASIQDYIDNGHVYIEGKEVHKPQIECLQIKQKFGTFRFYTNVQDLTVNGMIKMAAHICENTCQRCGSRQDIGYTRTNWVEVCCKSCASEFEKWISKKEIYASTSN